MSNVHEVQTVYNVVQDPQMVLLSEKGAHGVSVRCEKVCMLLPQVAHSKTICMSSPIAPLLQAKQTLLALSTWPVPANRPVAIGKP